MVDRELKSGTARSGSNALAGYEYQMDVSAWLALDLMLGSKLTQEILLEPSSQEDLEADLEENEPGRITNMVGWGNYTLIVQSKLRRGKAWTVSDVRSLLNHGGPNRQSASHRLSKSDVRYLLVTSAGLNDGTQKLQVRRAGEWPNPNEMPWTIKKSVPAGSAGRVAIIGNLDEEYLETKIRLLLTDSFRVPKAKWKACRDALHGEARIRMLRGGSGRWSRADLEHVIREHEGYLASSPELERYVYPSIWGKLRKAMRTDYAALIVGQSGTGKTMATRKLYEVLRSEIPGLSRVPITRGPSELFNDQTETPVLYDIEDPWGRFDFDRSSRPWNDQLAKCFREARHDRLVIATTRRDVAQSAGALKTVEPWIVRLDVEHYGEDERRELYRSRISVLRRKLQLIAQRAMRDVLEQLGTPLEIQKFFDALSTVDEQMLSNPRRVILHAIDRAHHDSIEQTVINQVRERDDIRAAIVLWGLLKTTDKLSLGMLRILEGELADKDDHLSEGVMPLVQFFVAARNFRQNEDVISYYHPRVEAGLEQIIDGSAVPARRTLRLLVERLSLSDSLGQDWGVRSATRLVAALDQKPNVQVAVSQEVAQNIDRWIEKALTEEETNFEENLRVSALAGSLSCNVAETARYLLNQPDTSFGGLLEWGLLDRDETWYARIRTDEATHSVIQRYLVDVLPNTDIRFPKSFAADVSRLIPRASKHFLEAAKRAVHFGVFSCADAIADGALQDLDGFEEIVDIAVEVLSPSDERRQEAKEVHLAIINREHSEEYAQFLAENDDGYTADGFLQDYVTALRRKRGWQSIVRHRHSGRLIPYWLKDLEREAEHGVVEAEELSAAFSKCTGSRLEESFWNVLSKAWHPAYLVPLVERIGKGHVERCIRQSALKCLMYCEPNEIGRIGAKLLTERRCASLVDIALDLAYWAKYRGPEEQRVWKAAVSARAGLPPCVRELSEASSEMLQGREPSLSLEARDLLAEARDGSVDVRRLRVVAKKCTALEVEEDVRWLLEHSEEVDICCDAIEAAICRGMTDQLNATLKHKFAAVSARALLALAECESAPLPDRYLAMVSIKGSPLRKALVELLDAKPHPDHLPTLLELAKDTWSRNSRQYGEEDDFPIARAAVLAIAKVEPVPTEVKRALYSIAMETSDQDLRTSTFALLARTRNPKIQAHLLELAIERGRPIIARAAVMALLQAGDDVTLEVAGRIEAVYLATRPPVIAVRLALLLAGRAEIKDVCVAAESLAANRERRVLLLLMVWLLKDRDLRAARMVADLLPSDHPGIDWALGDETINVDDHVLADLGDAGTCAEALVT